MYSSGHAGGGSITWGHQFSKRRKQRYRAVVRRTYPEPRIGTGVFAAFRRELYWFRRHIEFSLCFSYTDPELDEFEEEFKPTPPVVIQPIDELSRSTGFSKQKLRHMYREFKRECPRGSLDSEEFCKAMKAMFPKSSNTNYALRVYKALDRKGRGILRFEDLMETVIMLSQCPDKERAEWIFSIIDSEQLTTVDFEHFLAYVHSVYSLLGVSPSATNDSFRIELMDNSCGGSGTSIDNTKLKVDWDKLEGDTKKLFLEIDADNDGWISSNDLEFYIQNTNKAIPAIESILLHCIFPNNINHCPSELIATDSCHRPA